MKSPKITEKKVRNTLNDVQFKFSRPVAVQIIRQTGKAEKIAEIDTRLYGAVIAHAERVLSGQEPPPEILFPPPKPPTARKPAKLPIIGIGELSARHRQFLYETYFGISKYAERNDLKSGIRKSQADYALWFAERGIELKFPEE